MSPLLALSCRDGERMLRQLSGVKQTSQTGVVMFAYDPKRKYSESC
jgi:hypothetical protein